MNDLVVATRDRDVGVLTVNNPPVNALSPGVPEGIVAGVEDFQKDPAVRAIVPGELLRLVYTLTRSVVVDGRAQREGRMRALLAQGVRAIGPFGPPDRGGFSPGGGVDGGIR
jgi:hypothetical protein